MALFGGAVASIGMELHASLDVCIKRPDVVCMTLAV